MNNMANSTTKTVTIEAPIFEAEVLQLNNENRPSKNEVAKVINDKGEVNLSMLTPTQVDKCKSLTKNLTLNDVNSISNYGSDLQHTMSRYSNEFLSAVRASQGGEVGELINNLLSELNYVDVDELSAPSAIKKVLRKIPIINKLVGSVEKVLHKYDSIQKNVTLIENKIQATRLTAMKDNNALQTMFENNVQYGKQIEELIIAGKLKLQEVKEQLQEMLNNAENYETHEINDVQTFVHNLERRLNDMNSLRYVVKQSLPQIRIVQENNITIAEKAQSIIGTTIPVWKHQLSIAVALHNQKSNIEAHKKVTETTNTILKRNAELLKQNSIEVANANEESVISIETLRETTKQLVDTITSVKEIHEKSAEKRKEAEDEIIRLEKEIEQSLLTSKETFKLLN